MFRRLCMVQSHLLYSSVAKHLVPSPNKFHGFLVKPFVRKKSDNISIRSINVIEKETRTKIENDPRVIELEKALECSKSEAISVYVYFTKNAVQMDLEKICKIVKWLHRLGAEETSIILENCHLFSEPLESLKKSYTKLKRCDWKRFIDYMPLLSISESRMTSEYYVREIRNRVYLFSEHFLCEPHVVSHYCAKHSIMFDLDLDLLKRKIALLENNVSPENILRDLDLLARNEKKLKARIEYLKKCDIGHIMPWMLKCAESTLQRTIERRKKIAGPGSRRTLELLQKRLNLHGQTAAALLSKNDFLRELSYETVSERLEELQKIFTAKEIKENIKLLNHPVNHIRIRVAELIALDPSNISPKLFNMSDRKFIEYKNSIEEK